MRQTGTVNDYLELLDAVKNVATSNHVATVAINNAGTGYVAGDVLTVVGGTFTYPATILVLTTTGSPGPIASARVQNGGAYTVNPSLTGNAVTGGTGSSATMNLTIASTGWTKRRATQQAVSATVAAGGTGYSVGNDLTVVGGVGVGIAAVFNVDTISGGAVTGVSLLTAGNYQAVPTNPVVTTVAPLGGTGATLNVTWADASSTAERCLILEGNGGASETIFVGFQTYQTSDVSTFNVCYNWSCHGFTGFNNALTFASQVGISPGLPAGVVSTTTGAFMPLKTSTAFDIDFWFYFTNRRLIIVAKVANGIITHYISGYFGYMNPFGTSIESPYPLLIGASSSRHNTLFSDTEPRITGIGEVMGISGRTGPMWYWGNDSVWHEIKNSSATDTGSISRTSSNDYIAYPGAKPNTSLAATEDQVIADGSGFDWIDIIPNSGIPGTPLLKLQDTPMTGGNLKLLVPVTIIASEASDLEVVGELDDVFWFSGVGGVTSESTFAEGLELFRVFQNGNRAQEFSLFAVRETF